MGAAKSITARAGSSPYSTRLASTPAPTAPTQATFGNLARKASTTASAAPASESVR